jgi:hypothetical protein
MGTVIEQTISTRAGINTARPLNILTNPLPENGAGTRWAKGKIDAVASQGPDNFYLANLTNLFFGVTHTYSTPTTR